MRSQMILTETQLALVGAVAVESAYMEYLVESIIADLAGMPDPIRKAVLPDGMMIGSKLTMLEKLGVAKLRSKKLKTEFAEIVKDLKDANTERKIVIHGIWERTDTANWLLIISTGKAPTGDAIATHKNAQPMPAARLAEVAKRLNAGHERLWKFYLDVWHHQWMLRFLRSLPKEPRAILRESYRPQSRTRTRSSAS